MRLPDRRDLSDNPLLCGCPDHDLHKAVGDALLGTDVRHVSDGQVRTLCDDMISDYDRRVLAIARAVHSEIDASVAETTGRAR